MVKSLRSRRRPRRWCSGIGAFLVFFVGCARTAFPHDFDAQKARDYTAPELRTARKPDHAEILAVLLIPTNTIVSRAMPPPTVEFRYDYSEWYAGPARVFLPPGKRSYRVRVQGAEGVFELDLDATFEPGKRYELSVIEDGEQVAFELFELHPSSYAAIYPGD